MNNPKVPPSARIVNYHPTLGNISAKVYADTEHNDLARTSPLDIDDWFLREFHLAKDGGRALYLYHNGRYHGDTEITLKEFLVEFMRTSGQADKWNSRLEHNVLEGLRSDWRTKPLLARPPRGVFNLANGIYDIYTNKFTPHTPEFVSTFQLPIIYDPTIKDDTWEQCINKWFQPDCPNLVLDMLLWFMCPWIKSHKMIMLYGEGSNGKSMFVNSVQELLGQQNILRHELQSFVGSKGEYYVAQCQGKLLNIGSDIPSREIRESGVIKSLISNEPVPARHPSKRPFTVDPWLRFIFAMNEIPVFEDITDGMRRRQLFFGFKNKFTVDEELERKISNDLASDRAKSGLLNTLLARFDELDSFGFASVIPASCLEIKATADTISDPILAFIHERIRYVEGTVTTNAELISSWNDWKIGYPSHKTKLIRSAQFLARLRKSLDKRKIVIGDKESGKRGIGGIALITEQDYEDSL